MACEIPTTADFKQEIHLGDIGTSFELTFYESVCTGTVQTIEVVDISTATTMEIIFSKPDGTTVTQTAVFVTDGTDGAIRYFSQTGDLDQTGNWKVQGHVILPTGEWYSSISKFKVFANL